jgi:type I restriction enzyme, S subunit
MNGVYYRSDTELQSCATGWMHSAPMDWSISRLKFNASCVPSNVDKKTNDFEIPVKLCNYVDVYYHDFITADISFMEATATASQIHRYILKCGDILITKDSESPDDIGIPAFVKEVVPRLVCGYHLSIISRLNGIDPLFLYFQLKSHGVRQYFETHANGITRYALGIQDFSNLLLAFPQPAEQKMIARYLDLKTAQFNSIIAKKKLLIAKLEEAKKALISEVVTGKVKIVDGKTINRRPEEIMPSGVEWIVDVPKTWAISRIKYIAAGNADDFIDGDWIESEYISEEGIRLIQTGNIGIGVYKEQGDRYITNRTFKILKCKELNPGTILICRLAEPVGRACIAPHLDVKMITSVDVCMLEPNFEMNKSYVVYLLSCGPYLEHVDMIARGGTRQRISRTQLGDVRVPIPPKMEQDMIAQYLDVKISSIDALLAKEKTIVGEMTHAKQSLITEAVTGKIDLRDWKPDEQGDAS